MIDRKKLRKLRRVELLELLLDQSREIENLQEKLQHAEELLADRYIRLSTAGDLSRAVLEVNGVMDAAQAAAQQYLDNIARMEQETEAMCRKMYEEAKAEAARIVEYAMVSATGSQEPTEE